MIARPDPVVTEKEKLNKEIERLRNIILSQVEEIDLLKNPEIVQIRTPNCPVSL